MSRAAVAAGTPDRLYVGGKWTRGQGEILEIVDPSSETVVARLNEASVGDVDETLRAADSGFRSWRALDAWTRSRALRAAAELIRARARDIAEVMTREQGKPLTEAEAEVRASADQFDWFADEARRTYGQTIPAQNSERHIFTLRQPVGPVAAFTAWNFPALLPARKMAAALAAGCSIIVKPSREAPLTALCLAAVCHDTGLFPPGAVSVIVGESDSLSTRLLESDVVRKMSLTGSTAVGRKLLHACADRIMPATVELGGHAPVLIFDDADVERAAGVCVSAKFRNAGQVCISPTRFYVQEAALPRFVEAVRGLTTQLRVGDGLDPTTDVGPLTNARRLDAVERLVGDALQKGASVVAGGRRPAGQERGFFYEPTVLTGVSPDADLMSEEPFGPVLPITTFSEMDDAITQANSTPFGLAGYVFTGQTQRALEASERLEVGMVGVNSAVIATAEAPFGGVKQSGYGREGGSEGIEAYLVTKYVNIAP